MGHEEAQPLDPSVSRGQGAHRRRTAPPPAWRPGLGQPPRCRVPLGGRDLSRLPALACDDEYQV